MATPASGTVMVADDGRKQPQAGRIAFEVLVDQAADHAGQTAGLVAAVDDRHGSNTTFVASRRSNNA